MQCVVLQRHDGAVWVVASLITLQRGHSPVSFTLRAKARCCRCRCLYLCLCLCFAFVSLGRDSNVQSWCMLAPRYCTYNLSTGAYVRVCVCAHTLRVMYCGCAQSLWSKVAQGNASRVSASASLWLNNDVAQYCSFLFDSLALLSPRQQQHTQDTLVHAQYAFAHTRVQDTLTNML